jgi:hypothetical protein
MAATPSSRNLAMRCFRSCIRAANILAISGSLAQPNSSDASTVRLRISIRPDQVRIDKSTGIARYDLGSGATLVGSAQDPFPAFPVYFDFSTSAGVDSASVSILAWTDLDPQPRSRFDSTMGSWYPGHGSEIGGPKPGMRNGASLLLRPLQRYSKDGRLRLITEFEVSLSTSATILDAPVPVLPAALVLERNVPNPFAGHTKVRFFIPRALDGAGGNMSLDIYDVNGRHVRQVILEPIREGWHEATWDGANRSGGRVRPGTYFCRLRVGSDMRVQRLVLAK